MEKWLAGEREREKKKLLLEKKTVRKCRWCLTCVQQFVTIWFAMDWLDYTVGWKNLTYTKEGPSLQVLPRSVIYQIFPKILNSGLINLSSAQCVTINLNIQILFYWSTFKSGLICVPWHDEKKRLLTRLFFSTSKMMCSSWNLYPCASCAQHRILSLCQFHFTVHYIS